MSTKTISLSDSAYEKLKSLKGENESFSDFVNRIVSEANISEYHGVLSDETADEIEEMIEEKRERNRRRHRDRVEDISEGLK